MAVAYIKMAALLCGCAFAAAPLSVRAQEAPTTSSPLFLDVTIKNNTKTGKKIRAYMIEGGACLSFPDLARAFDFATKSPQENLEGFFFSPENTFRLSPLSREAVIRGAPIKAGQQDIRSLKDDVCISPSALLSWFDIGSLIDRDKNNIHFSTYLLLPKEARAARDRKRQNNLKPFVGAAKERRAITGIAQPEYEIELYHNDALIAYQNADDQGAYTFADVPLAEGDNIIRLVFYGPQGQREEKVETISLSAPPLSEATSEKKPADVKPATAMVVSAANETIVVSPKNWKVFSVLKEGNKVADVEVYSGAKGLFLRLDAALRALQIAYDQRASSNILKIILPNNEHIVIDLTTKNITDRGNVYKLHALDAFENEEKIYANEALLHRLLPSHPFVVDQAAHALRLPSPPKEAVASLSSASPAPVVLQDKKDIAPPPLAAPVTPVVVDDLVTTQRAAEEVAAKAVDPSKPEAEANDVLHIEQAPQTKATSDAGEAAAPPSGDGEPLILQPKLKSLPPSNEFVEALDLPGQVFLPLNDLFQFFEFPIKFDAGKTKARGYFFAPENDFVLDIDNKEVRIAGKPYKLTRREVRKQDGHIFISTEALSEWFGIASTVDRRAATIHFTTDRLFPKEEQEERQKRWAKLLRATEGKDDNFPVLQNEYVAFGYPTIDVNLGSTYSRAQQTAASNTSSFASQYNIQGAAELGYLTTQFYAQGATTSKAFDSLRLQAGRKDPRATLLGPLRATEFALGDVSSPSLSFVTNSSLGRGAIVTNRDVSTSENFDVRSFTGDSVPGYEVELYRNNVLVSFQTVDATGRYYFKDVPILYGENTFRLVFYGAQGQREERVETVSAASALLKEGKFEYTVGAVQRGLSLIPLSKLSLAGENTPNGNQFVGAARYGVTSNYTVGASVAETRLADGPHRYLSTSSGINLFGVLSETTFAKDLNGGWASGLSALTGFEGVSLRARYRTYNHFMSEAANSLEEPLTSQTDVDINAPLYLPLVQDFMLGLGAERKTFVDEELVPRHTFGLRFSKSVWGLSFTNTLDYITDGQKRVQDTFGIQTRLWDINFRATGHYELKPDQQFRTASFMADYRLTDRLSAQTQIERDISSNRSSFDQNINWDFDHFRLSLNNMIDSGGDYTIGLNVLFSLNHDKTTGGWRMQPQQTSQGGAIAGRVFVDENNNGRFDEGEKLVPDATVRVNRAAAKLDENGYFVTPVSPYEKSKVEISAAALSDPLLTPSARGYHVVTRPGDTVVADFPLVHTTIVDGTTYFAEANGSRREVGNIVVELQDKEGKPIRRVISEVDGYYSIDKVPAGDYWLSIPQEVLDSLNAVLKARLHVGIAEVKEFMTGNDLVLEQKEQLNGPPVFENLVPALPPAPATPAPTPPVLPSASRVESGSGARKSDDGAPDAPASNEKDRTNQDVVVSP